MEKGELEKTYNPQAWEAKILLQWEKADFANPDTCIQAGITSKDAAPFSVLMPPPNVTGVLHLGHAMENALMDTMTRYKRMRGFRTLFLPGADHAAVATQARVEKNLIEKEGFTNPRQELGREKLLEKIRIFAESSKDTIIKQVRSIGSSCDWSRFAYTFDEKRAKAVNVVFKKMYDDGLIYRGYRVVNWSVKGQSTASDDELVHIPQTTKLYTFRYSKDFPISIATTRPETKLGDTAVAVHPADERYQNLIGQIFTVNVGAQEPLEIKIIGDENVDPTFGTGAVGVTPAHSQVDFEMRERNGDIKLIQVIGIDGKMTEAAGEKYVGLSIKEAREKFVAWLKENDLVEKEEEITHNIGTSDRFGDVVEVLPMTQWFVDVNKIIPSRQKSLKDLMREAVTSGLDNDAGKKITIQPERFSKNYLHWIDDLRDWCISRQIWWGHRIPVWYRKDEIYCGIEAPEDEGWEQDPDTLDTWFSSGLWTFSTLGWPEETEDLKTFHPTSWMQMGYEILFFWMARMILMTSYTLETIPFKDVYIHGILRDKDGRKFSKSLGNGIDPIDVSATYGTDALRYSLLADITPGNDSRFSYEKVENARNLVNKIWNIGRYITTQTSPENQAELSEADDWILSKLDMTLRSLNELMDKYQFSLALGVLYDFTWNDFADWYVEIHKIQKNDALLKRVYTTLLRAWHPFIPFVTEALYQSLTEGELLMGQKYPLSSEIEATEYNLANAKHFAEATDLIKKIRNVRALYHIAPNEKPWLTIIDPKKSFKSLIPLIERLGRIEEVALTDSSEQPSETASIISGDIRAFLHLGGVIDIEKERARLSKEKEAAEKYKAGIEKRLGDATFTAKAPAHIIEQNQTSLSETEKKILELEESLNNLSK